MAAAHTESAIRKPREVNSSNLVVCSFSHSPKDPRLWDGTACFQSGSSHLQYLRGVSQSFLNPIMLGLSDGSVIKSIVARSLLLRLCDIQHRTCVSPETKVLHCIDSVNLHLILLATHR